jgi:hypothetical protein
MAFPTFKAAGTFTASIDAITPPYPTAPNAPVANDIAILVCESENQAISLSNAQGFVEIGDQAIKSAGTPAVNPASRLAVFWKRCVGSDTAPTVADSGDHTTGRIYLFAGVKTSGDPWDVYAEGNDGGASDQSGVIPGATTTVAECLVFLICTSSLNNTVTTEFTSWANASLGSLTERGDNTNTAGLGGGHGAATGTKATAGTYNGTTVWLAGGASFKGAMSIALAPPPPNHYEDSVALGRAQAVSPGVAAGGAGVASLGRALAAIMAGSVAAVDTATLGRAQGASPSAMAGSLGAVSLGAVLALLAELLAAGNNYEESVGLALSLGVLGAGLLGLEPSLSLARGLGASAGGQSEQVGTATLGRSVDAASTGVLGVEPSLVLGRSVAALSGGATDAAPALSFDRTLDLLASALTEAALTVSLGRVQATQGDALASAAGSASLGRSQGLAALGLADAFLAVVLARDLGLLAELLAIVQHWEEAISLSRALALPATLTAGQVGTVSLGRSLWAILDGVTDASSAASLGRVQGALADALAGSAPTVSLGRVQAETSGGVASGAATVSLERTQGLDPLGLADAFVAAVLGRDLGLLAALLDIVQHWEEALALGRALALPISLTAEQAGAVTLGAARGIAESVAGAASAEIALQRLLAATSGATAEHVEGLSLPVIAALALAMLVYRELRRPPLAAVEGVALGVGIEAGGMPQASITATTLGVSVAVGGRLRATVQRHETIEVEVEP